MSTRLAITAPVRPRGRASGATAPRRTRFNRVPPARRRGSSHSVEPVDLQALDVAWKRALDAAGTALQAAAYALPTWELRDRRLALAREVERTTVALRTLEAVRKSSTWQRTAG